MLEQPGSHIRNNARRQPRIPPLVPDRDDRGDDARDREHAEDLVQRLKILFTERIVDQEFQAERHDDVEQRLDQDADSDERQQLLVVDQERLDEVVGGGQRAGGFLGREDDEILVIIIVVEFQFVVVLVFIIMIRRRRGRLAAGDSARGIAPVAGFFASSSSSATAGSRSSEEGGFGAMRTNRCCTAGMTAIERGSDDATASILCDQDEFGKTIGTAVAADYSSDSTLSKNE